MKIKTLQLEGKPKEVVVALTLIGNHIFERDSGNSGEKKIFSSSTSCIRLLPVAAPQT
jgi:hypothetical protein